MSLPLPSMSVVCPTRTPSMSVMAFKGPGVPSKGTPRSRARSLCAASAALATAPVSDATSTSIGTAIDERGISGYSGETSAQAGSGAGGNHLAPPGGPPVNRVYEHAGGAHIDHLYEWLAADAERGPYAVDRSEERSHDPADLARAETPDLSTSPQH